MVKLDLYNDALSLLGLRRLATITDDTAPRYQLDGVYNRQGIEYCLQLTKPDFACKTVKLTGASVNVTYNWSFSYPADMIDSVGYWSDKLLQQPLARYIEDGDRLLCNFQYIWVRYVSTDNAEDFDSYTPSFSRVVAAYLALECATRLTPEEYEKLQAKFNERVAACKALDGVGNWAGSDSPGAGASGPVTTLSVPWVHIYNDALMILGLDEIVSGSDDSARRVKLDRTLSAGLVADLLIDTGWQFGQTTVKVSFDPSAEPSFGARYAIPKPIDMHYLYGIFTDEHKTVPLRSYEDEGQYFFCEYEEVYISYVTTTFLSNPANWPIYFKRVVAARMAKDAAVNMGKDVSAKITAGDMVQRANDIYAERLSSAMSTDATQSPPRRIADGSWTRARWSGRFNGRP